MNDYNPEKKTLGNLFRQNRRLVIPRYQRSYEWKEANIQDFYADFVATSPDRVNFIGNIVVDASKDTRYEVIDGQQRLITLTILLAAIRDILKEDIGTEYAISTASDLTSTFLRMGASFSDDSDSSYKLTPSKDLEEFFMYYVQEGGLSRRNQLKLSKKISHKHVVNAYKLFRKMITEEKLSGGHSDEDKVSFLRKTISNLENVTVILIEIFDQNVAYTIFESFNAKRVDLSIADLVKNYYFSKLRGSEDLIQTGMDRWDKVVNRVNSMPGGKLDRFLHYYYQSSGGRFPKSQLYRVVRNNIDADSSKFIKQLELATITYNQLKDGNIDEQIPYEWLKRINISLENINRFNVEQCFILLLSMFLNQNKLTPRYLALIVELVEKFTFLYSKVANGQANILESIYGEFAKELHESKPDKPEIFAGQFYTKLLKRYKDNLPKYDAFAASFKSLSYDKPQDKRLIQYVFEKMEVHNSRGGTMLGDYSNIDHIFPQNPPQGIKAVRDRHLIGNLLPIDRLTNSKIGNQLPASKIEIYRNITNITQVNEYIEFSNVNGYEMNDDLINVRGESIAEKAYNEVWAISK